MAVPRAERKKHPEVAPAAELDVPGTRDAKDVSVADWLRGEDVMRTSLVMTAVAILATTSASASAQEESWFTKKNAAPSKAFELTLGTGYTQPFGKLDGATGMPDVATPGLGIDLGAGYRIDPRWSIAATGQYSELTAERGNNARSFTPGIAVAYHFLPNQHTDPWVELGTGYRMLWETSRAQAPTLLSHGFQLLRARLGVDYHTDADLALGPVIGADMNVFLWQDATTSVAIASPSVSTFVFAGIQGRIDVGGTPVGTARTTSGEIEEE